MNEDVFAQTLDFAEQRDVDQFDFQLLLEIWNEVCQGVDNEMALQYQARLLAIAGRITR